jgi:hypothetical protein
VARSSRPRQPGTQPSGSTFPPSVGADPSHPATSAARSASPE